MALRDQPYLPLYVQDYLTDEKLNMCSPATQGVYIKIMCLFHKSETYGGILLKQKDKQDKNICLNFALKFARLLPFTLLELTNAITELLDENVLQIDGDFLYQKRMVRDNKISEMRSKSGSKGGKNTQGRIKEQKENFAKAKSEANSEIENENENISSFNLSNKDTTLKEEAKFDYFKLKSQVQVVETIYRKTVLSKKFPVTMDKFNELLDDFIALRQMDDKPPKNQIDYTQHFENWVAIQVKKPENHYKTMLVL